MYKLNFFSAIQFDKFGYEISHNPGFIEVITFFKKKTVIYINIFVTVNHQLIGGKVIRQLRGCTEYIHEQ